MTVGKNDSIPKNVFQCLSMIISNDTGYPGITGTFLHYMMYMVAEYWAGKVT